MGPIVLTQLATGLGVLAGAALVKSVMDQNPMAGPGQFPRCPRCNGSGHVSCMCSRWSDGDVGCRTCSGSGRMACSSCGDPWTKNVTLAQRVLIMGTCLGEENATAAAMAEEAQAEAMSTNFLQWLCVREILRKINPYKHWADNREFYYDAA
ncbi:hypothetical protein RJ639_029207 [Escallonia herrerae]|uniref:Uncharacterized protein n=1 Tax=Escallonia herrerae TaxID=1293975 RepID=A0AA88X6I6_9ASTE|nr:hypothetical protein RJ639_029207 [Escallonia herrerae]